MVLLPAGYCIDATEVTRDQYQAWLDTNPPLPIPTDPECGVNVDFAVPADCSSSPTVCQGDSCGDHPQVCVDWCDAYAYCIGVGKRLCGQIGGGPETNLGPNQWYTACSSGGVNTFPYGNAYDPSVCNGVDNGLGTTLPVGSKSSCQSSIPGYEGVYDLSGNVAELVDTAPRQQDLPGFIGGSCGNSLSFGNSPHLDCGIGHATLGAPTVQARSPEVGFRCCSIDSVEGLCPAPRTMCGYACLDLDTELSNCGACGHACPPNASCQTGQCVCPPPTVPCGLACVDLSNNPMNCGSCGHSCGAILWCQNGQCRS
jgi:formylglycine-generating enzyme required for sulfatase activity